MEIPDNLASALESKLYDMMYVREHNYNGADWSTCSFCRSTISDIKGDPQAITHDSDCLGVSLQRLFEAD